MVAAEADGRCSRTGSQTTAAVATIEQSLGKEMATEKYERRKQRNPGAPGRCELSDRQHPQRKILQARGAYSAPADTVREEASEPLPLAEQLPLAEPPQLPIASPQDLIIQQKPSRLHPKVRQVPPGSVNPPVPRSAAGINACCILRQLRLSDLRKHSKQSHSSDAISPFEAGLSDTDRIHLESHSQAAATVRCR